MLTMSRGLPVLCGIILSRSSRPAARMSCSRTGATTPSPTSTAGARRRRPAPCDPTPLLPKRCLFLSCSPPLRSCEPRGCTSRCQATHTGIRAGYRVQSTWAIKTTHSCALKSFAHGRVVLRCSSMHQRDWLRPTVSKEWF